jgi:hypothetical protein
VCSPSGSCSPPTCARPPAAGPQRSIAADLGEVVLALDLPLHALNRFASFYLQSDGRASQSLDKDLHGLLSISLC